MKQTIILIFLTLSINVFAQNPNDAIIVSSGGRAQIMNIQSKPKETKGSFYYNETWQKGTIKLFSGEEIKDYPLKYDMKMNRIDIKSNNSVKIISIGAIKEIIWIRSNGTIETLINTSLYKNTNEVGFFSVINDGKISLLKKTDLKLLESNYNGVVVAGNESKRYIKKEKYFICSNEKLTYIKPKKKKILKNFKDKAEMLEKYADDNDLNFKNDNDLNKIFNYYNSL